MKQVLLALPLVWIVLLSPAWAVDPPAKPTRAELTQWMMTYYQHPQPDQLVARVRQLAEFQMLRGNRPEANEVFFGKIMQSNPNRVAGWLDALADLNVDDRSVVYRAAWISQTAEAKKWLTEHGQSKLAETPPPPLVAGGPMAFEPYHLDQLWEWFCATGDDKPVRRIVGFFQLAPNDPQPGELRPSPPTNPADRAAAANYRIAGPAIWSALSLAVQQERVGAILKECEKDPAVPPRCGAWLKHVNQLVENERKKTAK